jgi:carboxyl-terminal processing protease
VIGARRFVIVSALAATAALAEAQDTSRVLRRRTAYEDLQMFSQVLNQIRTNHPDSLDTHELMMAAIQGMIHAADPHSYVIPAIRLDPSKEAQFTAGRLHPVPILFEYLSGSAVVVSVAAGSHARRLDILPGDELVAVDGKLLTAESPLELEFLLSGPKGSSVSLTFERRRLDGSLARLERLVRRERVEEASAIPAAVMLDSATGYVRITTFTGEEVASDLHAALQRLEGAGMRRLVLDLRDNGGGSVDEAARVAGEFLPRGRIVYTATGRKAELADTGRVQRSFWRSEKRYPIVVMINAGTASASELVAGALQDHDRALIYGSPSFGKSLMMRGFPLTDGSIIVLVVGHVQTPCGRVIQRQYRTIRRRDYYRQAGVAADTAGRPSCQTTSGRTVYGGGGIFPDVVAEAAHSAPRWMSLVEERGITLDWIGAFVSGNPALFSSLDAFASTRSLPAAALESFRSFADGRGVPIPSDADAERVLQPYLLRAAASAKWGDEGSYLMTARLDPEVQRAVTLLPQAAALAATAR